MKITWSLFSIIVFGFCFGQTSNLVLKNGAKITGETATKLVLKNTSIINESSIDAVNFAGELKVTGNASIVFNSNLDQLILNELSINGPTVGLQKDLQLNGNFNLNSGTLNTNNNDVFADGNWTNAGTFNSGASTVHFTKDVLNENQEVNNGTSALLNISKTGQSPLVISGDLKFSGNLTLNDANLGAGTLELVGNGNQTLSSNNGSIVVQNIKVSKAEASDVIQLMSSITVSNELNLNQGKIDLNGNDLSFSQLAGGSSSSYVITGNNVLKKNSLSLGAHHMPIGTSSDYTPVTVNFSSGSFTGARLEASTKSSKVAGLNEEMEFYLNRSWTVEAPGASSFEYAIQLQYASSDLFGEGDEATIYPVKFSNGVWYKPEGADFANATIIGAASIDPVTKILTWNGLTSFSDFGGVGDAPTPLPVELSHFSTHCQESHILVRWSTASEQNASHFILEKSNDGLYWRNIHEVQAAGNSQENVDYAFNDTNNSPAYYRLKQFDFDGKNEIFGPIFTSCDVDFKPSFTYPNPSNDAFLLSVFSPEEAMNLHIEIKNIAGQIIDKQFIITPIGQNVIPLQIQLAGGMYFITLKHNDKIIGILQHTKL